MGYEINTAGWGESFFEGSVSQTLLVDVTTAEGFAVSHDLGAVLKMSEGASTTVQVGPSLTWNVWAKKVTVENDHYAVTGPNSKDYKVINYTCTSEQSHTQIVNGPTTWINNGSFALTAAESGAFIGISASADGEVFITAGNGQFSLRTAETLLKGGATKVTGTTSAQLSGGGNSVLLNADGASLLCGTAGIRATAASTVISGTEVEIGLPNGPVPVATAPQVDASAPNVDAKLQAMTAKLQAMTNECDLKLLNLRTKLLELKISEAKDVI